MDSLRCKREESFKKGIMDLSMDFQFELILLNKYVGFNFHAEFYSSFSLHFLELNIVQRWLILLI